MTRIALFVSIALLAGCTYSPRCTTAERQKLVERSAAVPERRFTDAPIYERDMESRREQLQFNIARFNAICTKG